MTCVTDMAHGHGNGAEPRTMVRHYTGARHGPFVAVGTSQKSHNFSTIMPCAPQLYLVALARLTARKRTTAMTKFKLMAEEARPSMAERITTGSLYWKIIIPVWAAAFAIGWYIGGL